jgi:hypothetical protein
MPPASELPLFSKELNRSNLPSEVGELEPVDIAVLDDVDGLGAGFTWAKFVNPFEVQYAKKTLAARVSAAATCEELRTVGKQVAIAFSPPGTKLSGEQKYLEVEQRLNPKKFSHAWAQLSWS